MEIREVEHTLMRHEWVERCVCLVKEHNDEKYLLGYIKLKVKNGENVNFQKIFQEHCRKYIPDYMIPSYITVMEEFPMAASEGKYDRSKFPVPFRTKLGSLIEQQQVKQNEQLEETRRELKLLWLKVINVPSNIEKKFLKNFEDNTSIFTYGASSLSLIKLRELIHKKFGVDLSLNDLFGKHRLKEQIDIILLEKNEKMKEKPKKSDDSVFPTENKRLLLTEMNINLIDEEIKNNCENGKTSSIEDNHHDDSVIEEFNQNNLGGFEGLDEKIIIEEFNDLDDDSSDDEVKDIINNSIKWKLNNENREKSRKIYNSLATEEDMEVDQNRLEEKVNKINFEDIKSETKEITKKESLEKYGKNENSTYIIDFDGMFPNSIDREEFWRNMENKVDCITDWNENDFRNVYHNHLPPPNKNTILSGGVLSESEIFDYSSFNLTKEEALIIDPQIRCLLQLIQRLLDRNGICGKNDEKLRIGLFVGCGPNSYLNHLMLSKEPNKIPLSLKFRTQLFNIVDSAATFVAYKLGFTGPVMSIQTACSSSSTALHVGMNSLKNEDCDIAIVAGVQISFPSNIKFYEYQSGMIFSKSGRCRSFDKNADGFVSSDACTALMLSGDTTNNQRQFLRQIENYDEFQILASTINNDGCLKETYTSSNGKSMEDIIRRSLEKSYLEIDDIDYIEAHGPGTPIGDTIELTALLNVYKNRKERIRIGSAKSFCGHCGAASALVGIIRTLLAMSRGIYPPNLHFTQFSPEFPPETSKTFEVVTDIRNWPMSEKHYRYSAVNCLGQGGTNGHFIIAQKNEGKPSKLIKNCGRNIIIPLSSNNMEMLREYEEKILEYCSNEEIDLCRLEKSVVNRDLSGKYRSLLFMNNNKMVVSGKNDYSSEKNNFIERIVLLFSGQGINYKGKFRYFPQNLFGFQKEFEEFFDILSKEISRIESEKLRVFLYQNKLSVQYENKAQWILYEHLSSFIYQYILGRFLMKCFLSDKQILFVGHSVGEYVALALTNTLSFELTLKLLIKRAIYISNVREMGSLVAIRTNNQYFINEICEKYDLDISAINSFNQYVIGGSTDVIDTIISKELQGTTHKKLKTGNAFHTRLMRSAKKKYEKFLIEMNVETTFPSTEYFIRNNNNSKNVKEYLEEQITDPINFPETILRALSSKVTGRHIEKRNILFLSCSPTSLFKKMLMDIETSLHVVEISQELNLLEHLGKLWKRFIVKNDSILKIVDEANEVKILRDLPPRPLSKIDHSFSYIQSSADGNEEKLISQSDNKSLSSSNSSINKFSSSLQTQMISKEKLGETVEKLMKEFGEIHENSGSLCLIFSKIFKDDEISFYGNGWMQNGIVIEKKIETRKEAIWSIGCLSNIFVLILFRRIFVKQTEFQMDSLVKDILNLDDIPLNSTLESLTLSNLCSHTSSLPCMPHDFPYDTNSADYTFEQFKEAILGTKANFECGRYCSYSVFASALLGLCTRIIANHMRLIDGINTETMSYDTLIKKFFLHPLQLMSSGYRFTDMSIFMRLAGCFDMHSNRTVVADMGEMFGPACGIYSSGDDLARLTMLLTNSVSSEEYCRFNNKFLFVKKGEELTNSHQFQRQFDEVKNCAEWSRKHVYLTDNISWEVGLPKGNTAWIGIDHKTLSSVVILVNTQIGETQKLSIKGQKILNFIRNSKNSQQGNLSEIPPEKLLMGKTFFTMWTGQVVRNDFLNQNFSNLKEIKEVINLKKENEISTKTIENSKKSIEKNMFESKMAEKKRIERKEEILRNETEVTIMSIVEELLNSTEIDKKRSLTEIGMDSLDVIYLAERLSESFFNISIDVLFENDTVEKIINFFNSQTQITSSKDDIEIKTEKFLNIINFPSTSDIFRSIGKYENLIEHSIRKNGVVLLRGTNVRELEELEKFVEIVRTILKSPEIISNYVDGISPRKRLSQYVFTSTEYSNKHNMAVHNEMSYCREMPRYLIFYCRRAPTAGEGQTSLVDSNELLNRIPRNITNEFRKKDLIYYVNSPSRNMGIGKCWEDTYEVENVQELEKKLIHLDIEYNISSTQKLSTKRYGKVVRRHPDNGNLEIWCNHAHLFHVSDLPEKQKNYLRRMFGNNCELLPKHCTFGNGEEINENYLDTIRKHQELSELLFDWMDNDILIIDNYRVAHGRKSFNSPREILLSFLK
ncbi:hypothetical protein SNEBB_008568 [Seison nebaliae]|nr:hypothetical protein SNEBB_008568 [Seison nebaliae]